MARNRKRAKERRSTQPVAARPASRPAGTGEPESNGAPDPLTHAAPDAELAEAQLAVGRGDAADDIETPEDERELEELAAGTGGEAVADAAGSGDEAIGDAAGPDHRRDRRGGELAPAAGTAVAHRPGLMTRLVAFLKGSWAELQRVQWPDRRQVVQATGVVLGFVIVAGVFLGVADFVAGKLMTFILK